MALQAKKTVEKGAQIDLLIDRNDFCINSEMMALKLKRNDIAIELIVDATGLSVKEIEVL